MSDWYASTEHGHEGDTVVVTIALVSSATTHRGLHVGVTRGMDENRIHVITDTPAFREARDVLDAVLAHDRAGIPAVTQRRGVSVAPASATAALRRKPAPCAGFVWAR